MGEYVLRCVLQGVATTMTVSLMVFVLTQASIACIIYGMISYLNGKGKEGFSGNLHVTVQSSGVSPVLKPRLGCKCVRFRHKIADLERAGLISSPQL